MTTEAPPDTQTKSADKAMEDEATKGSCSMDLFEDSTIQFLYANTVKEDGRDVHIGDKVLAYFVICVQIGMYAYLAKDALSGIKEDSVPVTVSHSECGDKDFSNQSCDANDNETPGPVVTAILLLLAFIGSDIGGAVDLIMHGSCSQKLAGSMLMVEALTAVVCCAACGLLGSIQSGSEAILAAVGVAFIHDLDEKVRLVYTYCPKFRQVMATVCIGLVLMVVGIVLAFVLSA